LSFIRKRIAANSELLPVLSSGLFSESPAAQNFLPKQLKISAREYKGFLWQPCYRRPEEAKRLGVQRWKSNGRLNQTLYPEKTTCRNVRTLQHRTELG
jgi:hypothetical protein